MLCIYALITGSCQCEMVISNIGTIVLSLPASPSSSELKVLDIPSTATSTQVRILSLSNTISRLLVGPVADFVSPVASYLANGERHYPRKHRVSRIAFLAGSTILLASTFLWMEVGVRSQAALWAVRYVLCCHWLSAEQRPYSYDSIGAGISYGVTFTIL